MSTQQLRPKYPSGIEADERSKFNEGLDTDGVLNTGLIEHAPGAEMAVPTDNTGDETAFPSAIRYNPVTDEFEGGYGDDTWRQLGGGGVRWEQADKNSVVHVAKVARGYLIDNRLAQSQIIFPVVTRVGSTVSVADQFGQFATRPLTIKASGRKIYGQTDDMTISTNNVSATFTWSGDEQGWIITSGVGLGQGQVYNRTIFIEVLSAPTTFINLNHSTEMVDVYIAGARLAESHYTLTDTGVLFKEEYPAGVEVQVIEYKPIQLTISDEDSRLTALENQVQALKDGPIIWRYTATGGETVLAPGTGFTRCDLEINGIGWDPEDYQIVDSKIILSEPLSVDPITNQGDRVKVTIGFDNEVGFEGYVSKAELKDEDGATMVGTSLVSNLDDVISGKVLQWEVGAKVTSPHQVVQHMGVSYQYIGYFPHTIVGGSPALDGGVWASTNIAGTWVSVGDFGLKEIIGSENGATMVGVAGGGNLQQVVNYVTPWMFGIKAQSRATTGMTDYSAKLQQMIDYAVANNLYVDTQIPGDTLSVDSSYGYFIKSPIVLTGLAGIRGVLPIFVDGNNFTDTTGFNFAVVNANAQFAGTTITGNTTRGNLNYDWIEVRNINRRSGTVRGILWTATRSVVQKLRANGFNGRGIWLAHAYDSNFVRCEVEWCGNKDDWGFDAAFYTPSTGFVDETNGVHIHSLLVHNCTDRAWRGFGSKMFIGPVHEEATYSMENPTTPSAQDTRTSLGYMNSFFSSTGGSIGPVSIMPDNNASNRGHVFAFGAVGTSASTVYTTGAAVFMPGDPAQRGGAVGTVYCSDMYIIDQARTTFSRLEVTGSYYGRDQRQSSPVLGGYITTIVENIGDIQNCVIRNAVDITPAASHSYTRCQFSQTALARSTARVTFDNCIFSQKMTITDNCKMDFVNCLFSGGVSVGGTLLDVIFKGGQISGDIDFRTGLTGSFLFPDPPRTTGNVINWIWPTSTAVKGSRTRHISPTSTPGDTVERVYNGTAWVVTMKIPS